MSYSFKECYFWGQSSTVGPTFKTYACTFNPEEFCRTFNRRAHGFWPLSHPILHPAGASLPLYQLHSSLKYFSHLPSLIVFLAQEASDFSSPTTIFNLCEVSPFSQFRVGSVGQGWPLPGCIPPSNINGGGFSSQDLLLLSWVTCTSPPKRVTPMPNLHFWPRVDPAMVQLHSSLKHQWRRRLPLTN